MSVENLANVVMGELSFINAWLLILTVTSVVAVVLIYRKLKAQEQMINDLSLIQDGICDDLYKHR